MALNGTFYDVCRKVNSLQHVLLTDCFKHRMKINLGLNSQVFTVIWKPMPYVENGTEMVCFLRTVKKINYLQPVLTDCFKHRMKMNSGLNAQVFTVIWKPLNGTIFLSTGTVKKIYSLQPVLLTDNFKHFTGLEAPH
jgi:hypothetical protein